MKFLKSMKPTLRVKIFEISMAFFSFAFLGGYVVGWFFDTELLPNALFLFMAISIFGGLTVASIVMSPFSIGITRIAKYPALIWVCWFVSILLPFSLIMPISSDKNIAGVVSEIPGGEFLFFTSIYVVWYFYLKLNNFNLTKYVEENTEWKGNPFIRNKGNEDAS